jgi:hypothetical protein
MRSGISTLVALVAALACAAFAISCSGEGSTDPDQGVPRTAPSTVAAPVVTEGTPRVPALSGVEEADRLAAGWREDAELYAIASIVPEVDANGRSPGWLYTYVSPSAGAVASVSLASGEATITPEQTLPEPQIRDIAANTLPPPDELLDSPEAMQAAEGVRALLERRPAAQVSAGLDSFSTEDPVWIFSAADGEQRVEEKITALRG